MIRVLTAWGPAVVWAGLLFLSSARSRPFGMEGLPLNDKVAHFLAFSVLGATLARGMVSSGHVRTDRPAVAHLLLIALGVAYGLIDEWHQSFVPGRESSWGDLVADTAGVLVGYTLFLIWTRRSGGRTGSFRTGPNSHRRTDP